MLRIPRIWCDVDWTVVLRGRSSCVVAAAVGDVRYVMVTWVKVICNSHEASRRFQWGVR
jgi:hypothetical protein